MRIEIDIPHAFAKGSAPLANGRALRPLLDCMIQLNVGYLQDCADAGVWVPPLYRAGVVYDRTVIWDTIPAVIKRGYGDCKSLATWLIAERRFAGLEAEPTFRWVKNSQGGTDFHILVQVPGGFEDPSKVLGMGANENAPSRRRSIR